MSHTNAILQQHGPSCRNDPTTTHDDPPRQRTHFPPLALSIEARSSSYADHDHMDQVDRPSVKENEEVFHLSKDLVVARHDNTDTK